MDTVKPALSSRTIVAALVGIVALILSLFGVVMSNDQIASLTDNVYTIFIAVSNLIGIAMFIVAAIRRARATSQIGGVFTADPTKVPNPAALALNPIPPTT